MRNEATMGQSMATAKSYDSNRTTQTMRDEELKLRCEQQLLNKQIPINMHPQMVQNLNLGGPGQQAGLYQNPFSMPSIGAAAPSQANVFNIQPPLLGELNGFDLGGELDSSSEFMNFEESYRRRRNQIDILEDRSEGELGTNIELGESIGEIHPSLMHPG